MNLWTLFIASPALLILIGVVSTIVLRADDRARRIRHRLVKVIAPYIRSGNPVQPSARAFVAKPVASLKPHLKTFVGMDPQRREPYPIKLMLVVPVAVAIGWAIRWLLHGLIGPFSWTLVPLSAWFVIRSVFTTLDARRTAKLYRQFPDALATIVRAVRVGIPVTESIRAVAQDSEAPTAIEFSRLYDQIGIGAALEDALRDMALRNRLPEYRFFATALALQSQTGGGLTETLENLAEVVRKRVALKARGYALAAEARTSACILAALPVFAGGALFVMSPAYIAPLLQEGPGQTVFGAGVAWLGVGLFVMRLLIRKSLG